MVSRKKFDEIRKTYFSPDYNGTTVFLTDEFPKKILVITKHFRGSYYNKVIVEITPNKAVFIGTRNQVLLSPVYSIPTYPKILTVGPYSSYIRFFIRDCYSIPINMFINIFNPKFKDLIDDLTRCNINSNHLSVLISPTQFDNYFICENTRNQEIVKMFGFKPKDLRALSEDLDLCKFYFSEVDYFWELKRILQCSIKETIPYFKTATYFRISFLKNNSPELCRRILKYSKDFSSDLCRMYSDYIRILLECPDEFIRTHPICPKDPYRIVCLHNEIVNFRNREWIRNKECVNAQKQINYDKNVYDKAKQFEYSDEDYSIVACKQLSELNTEGLKLCHCVGSYIDSVSTGLEYILFLRKNDSPDIPYFTIDIQPNKVVRQIHGKYNCNLPDILHPFVEKWANKFDLDISNCNGIKAAL